MFPSTVIIPLFNAIYPTGYDSSDPIFLYREDITTSVPIFISLPLPSFARAVGEVIPCSLFFQVPSEYAIMVPVAALFILSLSDIQFAER